MLLVILLYDLFDGLTISIKTYSHSHPLCASWNNKMVTLNGIRGSFKCKSFPNQDQNLFDQSLERQIDLRQSGINTIKLFFP